MHASLPDTPSPMRARVWFKDQSKWCSNQPDGAKPSAKRPSENPGTVVEHGVYSRMTDEPTTLMHHCCIVLQGSDKCLWSWKENVKQLTLISITYLQEMHIIGKYMSILSLAVMT